MGQLTVKQFRVTNFRNIDDSDWIPLDTVTAFVGRNESGKTALLKALHKSNPATPNPYSPQHEFPRDRLTREFTEPDDWAVCAVEFNIGPQLTSELAHLAATVPQTVTYTTYYGGHYDVAFTPAPAEDEPAGAEVVTALNMLRSAATKIKATGDEEDTTVQTIRTDLLNWADSWKDKFSAIGKLKGDAAAVATLGTLRTETNSKANPHTATAIETFSHALDAMVKRAAASPVWRQMDEVTVKHRPVFIYFDRYGVLDSAIHLPRFLEHLTSQPTEPRVRTINAMFKHVKLSAKQLVDLGKSKAEIARAKGEAYTDVMIEEDRQNKDLRAIWCNSASIDISKRFSAWWKQRRHKIRYDVDGDFFRIWVADDRRPDVELELESRSAGFQWFFSFYLVFLVESEEGHRDAVLLLDEPGLQLHPTAQQELIAFFEELAKTNQLVYTTHSPFLIDGDHLERVRPVTEDETGHSKITLDGWPKDRETIFPLQAAAGYAMVRGLFQHKNNVLVEGMADYFYLHGLSLLCNATGRTSLPEDIYVTPCGGAKMVGNLAALFLGQNVRPLILLDSDDAGRARRNALMKELYVGYTQEIIMLGEVLNTTDCEIEDIVGEALMLPEVNKLASKPIKLTTPDRAKGSLVDHIKAAATRLAVTLPDGWKAEVARRLVTQWASAKLDTIPANVLDRASTLFATIRERFEQQAESLVKKP